MHIAFISLMKILPWGGSEDLWFKTAKLAIVNGHSISTLTQKWSTLPNKILELQQLGANTQFYYTLDYSSFSDRIAIKLRLKRRVVEMIPDVTADVYIISNGSTWDFIRTRSIVEYLIGKNKPYVLISQHNFENGDIVRDHDRGYAIRVIQQAAKFFFVSQRNLEAAERQIAYFITNNEIISNPLNTNNKEIRPYPQSSSLLMACVARLECEFKGQDILLQALSDPQWAVRDFRLKLFGTGHHYEYLQTLIGLYGLQEKVTLEGHVSNVDHIWETNQVLILSSFSEGTPLSLLEAMMAGRAVLATDVGDNSRYVLMNKTGILVDTASVVCMRVALEQLWNAKHLLEKMGQDAFRHAQLITDFHPEKTLLNFIKTLA